MIGTGRSIARFASGFDADRVTKNHLRECGRAFADTCAVAIAGLPTPVVQKAFSYVRTHAPSGPARLWGGAFTSSLVEAAFFNAIAGHALDYDDASSSMGGHPSVVLLPALVAISESRGKSGLDLATAYLVGFEIASRIGRGLSQIHYDRGWHMTATVGTIACAAACARLLSLAEDQTCHAIGLAIAQTAGTRANFGTDAKPFQAGHAAAAGVRSALLAESGFTASGEVLEGDGSFTQLYSQGEDLGAALAGMGDEPFELDSSGIEIKKYAACYALHRPLDGVLDLRAAHGLNGSEVSGVAIVASRGALAPLIPDLPRTGNEARFSMQYAIAAALHDGDIQLSTFTDSAVQREDIGALMGRITATEAPGTMLPRWASVRIALNDGRILTRRIDSLRGAPQSPLSDAQLLSKVADCLRWGGSTVDAAQLLNASMQLHSIDVAGLLDRVAPTFSQESL
jgi:2-methylcitrate dehydratase PrpD